MTTPTLDAILRDPALLQSLRTEARRERSEHNHRLLKRLFEAWGPRPHHSCKAQEAAGLRTAPCC